jgi:hypothetical protein
MKYTPIQFYNHIMPKGTGRMPSEADIYAFAYTHNLLDHIIPQKIRVVDKLQLNSYSLSAQVGEPIHVAVDFTIQESHEETLPLGNPTHTPVDLQGLYYDMKLSSLYSTPKEPTYPRGYESWTEWQTMFYVKNEKLFQIVERWQWHPCDRCQSCYVHNNCLNPISCNKTFTKRDYENMKKNNCKYFQEDLDYWHDVIITKTEMFVSPQEEEEEISKIYIGNFMRKLVDRYLDKNHMGWVVDYNDVGRIDYPTIERIETQNMNDIQHVLFLSFKAWYYRTHGTPTLEYYPLDNNILIPLPLDDWTKSPQIKLSNQLTIML